MASTYLQLVNNVLTRLRETEVSSVEDTPYSSLIGVFVNDAKREVEDAHEWNALATTIVVPTVSGQRNYTLTGSGERFKTEDVLNDTENVGMRQAPQPWLNRQYFLATVQDAAPYYYSYNGFTAGGDAKVDVWPQPDAVYQLRFELIIPQLDLVNNSDNLIVPAHLVQMLAYAKAVGERGEDGGSAFGEIYQQYRLALADAVAIERNRYEDQVVWTGV
jgi:hypothetical protein